MNVYTAEYYEVYHADHIEIMCIIVANTEAEALALALEKIPDSVASRWDINKVDTNEKGAIILLHQIDQ